MCYSNWQMKFTSVSLMRLTSIIHSVQFKHIIIRGKTLEYVLLLIDVLTLWTQLLTMIIFLYDFNKWVIALRTQK